MPRRAAAQIRQIEPDPVHRSRLVQQVINKVMLDGKKSTAERIVYDALSIIGERTGKEPVEQLEASLKILTPTLEVRSRRVGGATYQVPVEVPQRRARTLAVRVAARVRRRRQEWVAMRRFLDARRLAARAGSTDRLLLARRELLRPGLRAQSRQQSAQRAADLSPVAARRDRPPGLVERAE